MLSVPVAVMGIRVVRMPMPEEDMRMPVCVRLAERVIRPVAVPVMIVMNVAVLVIDRRMFVLVLMPLGQMEPHADAHEYPCDDELQGSPARRARPQQ